MHFSSIKDQVKVVEEADIKIKAKEIGSNSSHIWIGTNSSGVD